MNNIKKSLFKIFSLLLILSSACGLSRETKNGFLYNTQIKGDSKIYIINISDIYKKNQNSKYESAIVLIATIRSLLTTHGFKPYVGKALDVKEAILEAESMQCNYVLKATVIEFKENTDLWFGKPASYELGIELYDVANGDLVGLATHRIVGPKRTIFQTHPDRFIPEAADQSLSRIFHWAPTIFADQ